MKKKNFCASVLTILVQYYDYHIFGFMAANIASNFFPSNDSTVQLLYTYLLMSIAMIAKPIGAMIFGRIGDLKGRSNSFKISLIGTSIASLIISIVPTYETVGLLSAFILLICRMCICAFVSSGADGVRIYVYELLPSNHRCLGIGITTLFTQSGTLLASVSAWYFTLNTMPDHAWRFPFFIGSILGILVYFLIVYTKMDKTEEIEKSDNYSEYSSITLLNLIRKNSNIFILSIFLAGCIGASNQFMIVFFGNYHFKILSIIDRSIMQQWISYGLLCYMVFCIIGGYLADRFGPIKIILLGGVAVIINTCLIIFNVKQGIMNGYLYVFMAVFLPCIVMPAAAIYKQSIPKAIRYRLFSISHAIGSIVISSPTAFLMTLMYHKTNISWLPFVYFILVIIVLLLAVLLLNRNIHGNKIIIK